MSLSAKIVKLFCMKIYYYTTVNIRALIANPEH